MVNEEAQAIAFGRTRIVCRTGETFDQAVQAIVFPANTRGIMPSSGTHSLRLLAGAEIERQTMAMAPLNLGTAVSTGAGMLSERGIERLFHAVVSEEPGGERLLPVVRRALFRAFELAHSERIHSLAVPLMTGSHITSPDLLRQWIGAIVDEVISHVRRERSRLDLMVLVSRYPEDLEILTEAVASARTVAWHA